MAELFPLADLRDPLAFLRGARIPLHDPDPRHPADEWHWCGDFALRVNRQNPGIFVGHDPEWYRDIFTAEQVATGLDLALDLSNEDVARWVDRKIAAAILPSLADGLAVALIGCTGDVFFLVLIGRKGEHSELALRPHGLFACLASITPTEANIPTARAALLRALFGRETK